MYPFCPTPLLPEEEWAVHESGTTASQGNPISLFYGMSDPRGITRMRVFSNWPKNRFRSKKTVSSRSKLSEKKSPVKCKPVNFCRGSIALPNRGYMKPMSGDLLSRLPVRNTNLTYLAIPFARSISATSNKNHKPSRLDGKAAQ